MPGDGCVDPASTRAGEGAAAEIAAAIELANRLARPIDVLVVARGGGSLEDLWCFNEEIVLRAIHASRIPVVSAIGHEIDVTLADLVADVRALTPSEAAERVVPSTAELWEGLQRQRQRLATSLRTCAATARQRLESVAGSRVFRRPRERVHELVRRVDDLESRAQRALDHQLRRARSLLDAKTAHLDSLSPLAILARGYSLTRRLSDGRVVRDGAELVPGDRIATRFAAGEVTSRVEDTFVEE